MCGIHFQGPSLCLVLLLVWASLNLLTTPSTVSNLTVLYVHVPSPIYMKSHSQTCSDMWGHVSLITTKKAVVFTEYFIIIFIQLALIGNHMCPLLLHWDHISNDFKVLMCLFLIIRKIKFPTLQFKNNTSIVSWHNFEYFRSVITKKYAHLNVTQLNNVFVHQCKMKSGEL